MITPNVPTHSREHANHLSEETQTKLWLLGVRVWLGPASEKWRISYLDQFEELNISHPADYNGGRYHETAEDAATAVFNYKKE